MRVQDVKPNVKLNLHTSNSYVNCQQWETLSMALLLKLGSSIDRLVDFRLVDFDTCLKEKEDDKVIKTRAICRV